MASSSKKKTTFAKMTRENKVRERQQMKQAKRDARKQEPSESEGGATIGDPIVLEPMTAAEIERATAA